MFFIEVILMFLWVRVAQLPPEVQVVHEGRGNQEHRQYQEHPIRKERNQICNYSTLTMYIYLL